MNGRRQEAWGILPIGFIGFEVLEQDPKGIAAQRRVWNLFVARHVSPDP